MAEQTHFYGSKEHGYVVERGRGRVEVKRVGCRWMASYGGIPNLHNPFEQENGREKISCMCPMIVVGTKFRTRQAAADAALAAQTRERKLWEAAARMLDAHDRSDLKRQREIYAQLAGSDSN